ncbi:hypothetical protein N7509_009092 [Penicillium cosmopolitanum]|uniref:Uncharacterized protein n=1 Tax=Penicillium cosmopolitanum TaxID=1131564 RepID=A0A9W9VNR3_9EURO|nr:uncharacterized protein N7509_009092 [Penicillium cosmopolitanum]KAJ5386551.1 hypothetical protein N7509_009092 [Penicillium cosmopolitanum]
MAMDYLKNRRRSSQIMQTPNPVLTSEDEAFLQQVTSQQEHTPGSAGPSGGNATDFAAESPVHPGLKESAQDVPLPASPAEEFGKELGEEARENPETTETKSEPPKSQDSKTSDKKKKTLDCDKKSSSPEGKDKSDIPTASTSASNGNGQEASKDEEDMKDILEHLNLAAENNKVFSMSEETQELLRKFKLIFKDLINGVPTAYHDLEMLLTNGNRQLQDTYTKLPGPMQKLIEKLPEKWTETLAPEMIAVAGERASKSGVNMENVGKAAAAAEKMGLSVPSLKELVSKPAAIVGMLRSIMTFLRARFPAVLGMNVLWSLALFILLFVLWYCHKRGREVRLENERLVTEEEINQLNEDNPEGRIRATETLTTTAPQGASSEEVREGVKKAEEARASAADVPSVSSPQSGNGEIENVRPAPVPTRSKSRLSIFGRSKPPTEPNPNISPYPGT